MEDEERKRRRKEKEEKKAKRKAGKDGEVCWPEARNQKPEDRTLKSEI